MEDATSTTALDTTPTTEVVEAEVVESAVSVADQHDHAEGRGLPVQRIADLVIVPAMVAGNYAAGWGLIPPGAVVWFRTLAELTAAGAGWTRETTLDGLLPIGAGTTFLQTFAEATSYGSSWAHLHDDAHTHTGPLHSHSDDHLHNVNSHTHTGVDHLHGVSITAGTPSTTVSVQATGGPVAGSTHTHLVSGNTAGVDRDMTSGSTAGATDAKSTAGYGGTTGNEGNGATGAKSSGSNTSNTTWLPPSRCGIFGRKL